jgi:hypothetical protein
MKWKTNTIVPKEGDKRTKRKFAFLPIKTTYDYTVWLETYDSVQEYRWSADGAVNTWNEVETIPLFIHI